MGCEQKGSLSKISHTYSAMMKLGAVIPYLKKIQNIYKKGSAHLHFCWHQYFFTKTRSFCYINKYGYRLHFTWFLILLTFFYTLKVVLINIVAIVMMLAKLAALGLLRKKIFWNKYYDVIIYVHDVTKVILSRDSK